MAGRRPGRRRSYRYGLRYATASRRGGPAACWWSSGSFLFGGGGDAAQVTALEPVGIAFERDYLGVVDEPVDHRGGDHVVAEYLAPPAERLIAGHDQAGPLIPGRYQLEEQVGGLGLERDVADLIDDQDGIAAQPDQLGLQPSGVVGLGEPGDPSGGGGERDPVPGAAGAARGAGGGVRLACPGGAQDPRVVAGGDKARGARVRDALAFRPAGGVVVEAPQRLGGGDRGGGDAAFPAVG